jgi:anti-anti-sigma regulatory factor
MATNFRITAHRNNENLHLKLAGDFDGSSAFELLDTIRSHSHHSLKIFIHTNSLKTIEPFGLDVFHSHFDLLKGESVELVFTGKNAAALAPDKSPLFGFSISTLPDVNTYGMDHRTKSH